MGSDTQASRVTYRQFVARSAAIRAASALDPISKNRMAEPAPPFSAARCELIVLSDDWGRHPSSCQHLVRELMQMHGDTLEVTWVNTIGTRTMRCSAADLKRAAGKLRECMSVRAGDALPTLSRGERDNGRDAERGGTWTFASRRIGLRGSRELWGSSDRAGVGEPRVVAPVMWPGFRNAVQRGFNARSMARAIRRALGPKRESVRRIVLTTLPIAADLPGRLDADRWVYMAVDDFSLWPRLDGSVMDAMERRLVPRVDAAVAASETLRDRLAGMGCEAGLLTHGIDAAHWQTPAAEMPGWFTLIHGPMVLFWGLIDARLDVGWCRRLASESGATLVVVGPTDGEPPASLREAGVVMPGPAAYEELPAIAGRADVLVMPYIDAPVTRAMQPLKLKEYLATDRPVVARDLPATRPWADACDLVSSEQGMIAAVKRRLTEGTPAEQRAARQRLGEHSWRRKAQQLWAVLNGSRPKRGGLPIQRMEPLHEQGGSIVAIEFRNEQERLVIE